ncbi:MAG: amidohydrolase family protein [Thermoanaerobaculia bacterium]|nr:amidohydrolase family protein [Thermoanaerobaculia bacterium]
MAGGTVAIRGETVYPVSGEPITDGIVLIEDGKISAVGPASEVVVPDGIRVLQGAVVLPGLIDAHSVVGLAGYLNQSGDQDQLETSAAVQPELRAIDAFDARAPLITWLRDFGVTTLHTGHGPGTVVSGQTMIVKTRGDTVEEATLVPRAMLAVTLGEGATSEDGKSPGNRSKVAAMLRAELLAADAYRKKIHESQWSKKDEKPDPPSRDLKLETLAAVLDGELPMLITAQRHQDIMTALRLREEFGFQLVLDGGADAHLLLEEIKAAGISVITHPPMMRAWGEMENMTMEAAAILDRASIPIAFQSGFESYVPKTRVVLFEAAIANAYGLGTERTLHALTLGAAEILGIADRVGSLEVGKDGDVAIYDGDPFEYTTHCTYTVIEGAVVSEGERSLSAAAIAADGR